MPIGPLCYKVPFKDFWTWPRPLMVMASVMSTYSLPLPYFYSMLLPTSLARLPGWNTRQSMRMLDRSRIWSTIHFHGEKLSWLPLQFLRLQIVELLNLWHKQLHLLYWITCLWMKRLELQKVKVRHDSSQFGYFRTFLSLRFYMKSIFNVLKWQILHFLNPSKLISRKI